MGCDCHCILQKKVKGKWVDKEILDIDRDYSLFGVLAGVRGSYEVPIDSPRGYPKDFEIIGQGFYDNIHLTPLVNGKDYYGNEDAPNGLYMGDHSHSWLTLDEINRYKHWHKLDYVQQEFKDLFFRCPNLKNWRLVFGFDS